MLKVEHLSVSLSGKEILKDISFSVKPHTLTCIIGKNGSGKSTLLSSLVCAVKYKGQISFCDKNIALMPARERAKLISLLPQQLPCVALTCEEIVKMGRMPYLDVGQRFSAEDKKNVEKAAELMGIKQLMSRRADCISGGERQKVFLAMTLAQQTRIMAFDEPTTYLDIGHRKEVYDILRRLKREEKKTVIAVVHDLTEAVEMADNILLLDGGEFIFSGSVQECISSGLIERVFEVRKYEYEAEDGKRILYK